MGKKAKEHRKKVQKRNQQLQANQKKLIAELQEQFNQQMKQRAEAQALRAKSVKAPPQSLVYATTGDFISQNYDTIFANGGQDLAQKLLDSNDEAPRFR
ncbi:MAG: hypothetical protein ACO3EY_03625 [Candidatus Nanopelagicales bacterium]